MSHNSKVKLYIATSLDGKIARIDGDVSWLEKVPNPAKEDYGYASFFDSIGVTLMGNKTYQEILSFGIDFPYQGKTNYVFTRNTELEKDQHVTYISKEIPAFVRALKEQDEDIWLIGGSEIIALLLNENLVDEILLFVMPVAIGEGIPLLPKLKEDISLNLKNTKTWSSGVVELNYQIK